jgi:acetyl-CoA acetyltransferase
MGVGPAMAIPADVKSADLEIGDIDLFELNEVCVDCLDLHSLLSPIYP